MFKDKDNSENSRGEPSEREGRPDVFLDAPQLKAEEIGLDLAKILKVEIKSLEAELRLEADLENLTDVLNRIVDAVGRDRDAVQTLLRLLSQTLGAAVEEVADIAKDGPEATEAAEPRARELDVDLSSVSGTGSGNRVLVKDVENAAESKD